jgi:hypothetical protein
MNIYICFQIVAMDILHCPDSLSYIRRVTISTIIQIVKICKGSYLNTYRLIKMYVQENDNSWKKRSKKIIIKKNLNTSLIKYEGLCVAY